MDDLANKKCIPCEGGIPGFDITEIHKYLNHSLVFRWTIRVRISSLIFKFKVALCTSQKCTLSISHMHRYIDSAA